MKDNFFINHPYIAIVIAIIITICGLLALVDLPVAQYPNVTPPEITVTVFYPGADAETLLNSVIEPLENQINGVEDMIYISSSSSNSGNAVITVTFKIGSDNVRNRDNVQNRVNWALSQLPEVVQKEGIVVQQQSGNILLCITLYSPEHTYDSLFLGNYANIKLIERVKRIDGVANVMLFGSSSYAMRIWLDDAKLTALNISVSEVLQALQSQNIEVSSGVVGTSPSSSGQNREYIVKTLGRLKNANEFGNIIIKSIPNAGLVKLNDIAKIELGAETYSTNSTLNNQPSAMMVVFQNSNANALDISQNCKTLMEEAKKDFPVDLEYGFQYDSTRFIRDSIKNVVQTLLIAFVLVGVVVIIFLQNFRMTVVPLLAIIVSIIGTFAILKVVGYSLNLITLFALILAIGIVVDDAILVIENVSRLMKEEQLSGSDAAKKSMTEITGAIFATTCVLLSMFIPISFLSGITGELYRQFGVTLSIAVILSAINALTLSPALASIILKVDTEKDEDKNFIFRAFNLGFSHVKKSYDSQLKSLIKRPKIILVVYLVLSTFVVWTFTKIPKGFIPPEDQGVFFANLAMPPNSSLKSNKELSQKATELLTQVPGVSQVISTQGFNVLNMIENSANSFLIVVLDSYEERAKAKLPINKVILDSNIVLAMELPEVLSMLFEIPVLPGIGAASGFSVVVENLENNDPQLLNKYLDEMLFVAMQKKELANVFSTFNTQSAAIYLDINREKLEKLGVNIASVNQVLQSLIGFSFVNQFNQFTQVYKVEVQGQNQNRDLPKRLMSLHVKNFRGEMVPFSAFAKLKFTNSAATLEHYNLHLSATIQGEANPEFVSSSEAMLIMEDIADNVLPKSMSFSWTGMSYQQMKSANLIVPIFILAITFIYLFLSGLYESFILPFSILLVIPMAIAGACGLLIISRVTNNLYTQIGMILLFGMACKTSILIIDFAKQAHDRKMSLQEAALKGANLRFRAVLMTAIAFIAGTLPLIFSGGAGSGSQKSIGVVVVGGMVTAVIGGLILVPVFYILTQGIIDRIKRKKAEPK